MDVSKFLSKVIGIYLVIISLAFFINMKEINGYVQNMLGNTELMFVTGFYTLIIGILLVVSHNIWKWSWKLIITIIGWIVFLKGISLIFYPHFVDTMSQLFIHNATFAYVTVAIDFIIGLILLYFGFRNTQ